jgi:sec-independent protein translocase protein TatB
MGTPPQIMMANLGMADTLILMVLALVVFGPRRLPQIGRQIGKLMYEFRKASNDFKFQMEEELRQSDEADRRKKEEETRQKALAAAPPAPQLEQTAASAAPPATPETSTESPYPEEITYPDLATESTRPEEATEDSTAPAVEAARLRIEPIIAPRIQPPSTGEVVAANPPGQVPRQAELFESPTESSTEPATAPPPEDATTVPESTTPDAANGTRRSEPAPHHG